MNIIVECLSVCFGCLGSGIVGWLDDWMFGFLDVGQSWVEVWTLVGRGSRVLGSGSVLRCREVGFQKAPGAENVDFVQSWFRKYAFR